MKAIFVESYNGYLAKSADDDMSWTPSLDKKIYKLLTYVCGGVCICSKHTYDLLPTKMTKDPNRSFIIVSQKSNNDLISLNKLNSSSVLIGGPNFLKMAYDLGVIDTFIVTSVFTNIEPVSEYVNPFKKELLFMQKLCEIKFDEMIIRVYKNNYSK